MIKGLIIQEDITVVNIYASNMKASKYTKQKLTELKAEMYLYCRTLILPVSTMVDNPINMETANFNKPIDPMHLTYTEHST